MNFQHKAIHRYKINHGIVSFHFIMPCASQADFCMKH